MEPIRRNDIELNKKPVQTPEVSYKQLIERCIEKIDEILGDGKEKLATDEYSIKTYNFLKKYGHIE